MAALTPSTVGRESIGSMTFIVAQFTTCATGDTWTSGLGSNVLAFNAQPTSGPTTQASAGATVAYSSTTGIFTLKPGEDGNALSLQIACRI